MRALRDLMKRLEATLGPRQRQHLRGLEAERLDIAPGDWGTIRNANVDLALLRAIHRAVTGERPTIRRAELDGSWALAAARPGQLRSVEQAFRAGDHVEPAWGYAALKRKLAAAISDARRERDPVRQAAKLVAAVVRAQPFLGDNERVAMIAAACLLHSAGLPVPAVGELEGDRALRAASVDATPERPDALVAYLDGAVWEAALALAEGLRPRPATATDRWTLADEHAAADELRRGTQTIPEPELDAIFTRAASTLAPQIEAALATSLKVLVRQTASSFPERLAAAIAASGRLRRLCPHASIRVQRWRVDDATGLELVLVLGAAGQGLTGAMSAHAALELPGVPLTHPAPAILFVPDEPVADRERRIATWSARVSADGRR